MAVTFELNDKFTLSLEEAGVVEGVGWMNYFLVIFIALPLALLLTVKVTQNLPRYLLLAFPGDIQQDGTRQKSGDSKIRIIVLDISGSVDIAFLRFYLWIHHITKVQRENLTIQIEVLVQSNRKSTSVEYCCL